MTPKKVLAAYKKLGARIETKARTPLRKKDDFSLWYTPGVGVAASHLAEHPSDARWRDLALFRRGCARLAFRVGEGSGSCGGETRGPRFALDADGVYHRRQQSVPAGDDQQLE